MNLWHRTRQPNGERERTEILIFISTHKQLRRCLEKTDEFGKKRRKKIIIIINAWKRISNISLSSLLKHIKIHIVSLTLVGRWCVRAMVFAARDRFSFSSTQQHRTPIKFCHFVETITCRQSFGGWLNGAAATKNIYLYVVYISRRDDMAYNIERSSASYQQNKNRGKCMRVCVCERARCNNTSSRSSYSYSL